MQDDDPSISLKERGLRLKQLRELMGEKRQNFAKKVGVTRVTLSYWENASTVKGGLHEDAARKIINITENAGIVCDLPWLLYGIGEDPCYKGEDKASKKDTLLIDKQKEIDLFLASSRSAVVTSITDGSMSPIVDAGDIVGGLWQSIENIKMLDKTYIVEIENRLQVRKIRKTKAKGRYDVFAVSYSADPGSPFEIKGITLTRVAPVIRLWR